MSSQETQSEVLIAVPNSPLPAESAAAPPIPANTPNRSSLTYLVAAFAGGNLIATVLGAVGGVLQARYVDKVTLGTFAAIDLALGWMIYLQLGVNNGLGRELPYYFGRGDRQRVNDLAATAQTWLISIGVLIECGFLAAAGWFAIRGQTQLMVGCAAFAAVAVVYFYSVLYLQSTYRTAHDFARLSLATTLQNLLGLAMVATVYWFGFDGLCLRAVVSMLVGMALLHWWRPIRIRCQWNPADFRHLLVIGFPIFFVGELGSRLWMLVDTTLVGSSLNVGGLGLYSIVVRREMQR